MGISKSEVRHTPEWRVSNLDSLHLSGFRGEIFADSVQPHGVSNSTDEVDMVKMAEQALNYLANNPRPDRDYECRFSFFLFNDPILVPLVPSTRDLDDPVTLGDTESRMDYAFIMMREMAGGEKGRAAQEGIRRRIMKYLRDDGLCWVIPYCASPDTDKEYAMAWTTGKLLYSLSHQYRLTGEEHYRKLARKLFEGLRGMASWHTGRAFYQHGAQAWHPDGCARGYEGHYPWVVEPVLTYFESTGDQEAFDFGLAMGEGMVCDLQPGHLRRSNGFIGGHTHANMHTVIGVAHLGALTRDPRYIEWARVAYDHIRFRGLETGWVQEMNDLEFEPLWLPHTLHSETCLVGDMVAIGVYLAQSGYTSYWDHVERTVRNYLKPTQFKVTPQLEEIYHRLHPDNARANAGLKAMRELEGGFISSPVPNDWAFSVPKDWSHHGMFGPERLVLDMMGCCPPEGMRGLHTAWSKAVVETPEAVQVNLALERDAAAARVTPINSGRQGITVHAKRTGKFLLRVPAWVDRLQVMAFRSMQSIPVEWKGDYVSFADVKAGEDITIAYPSTSFRQRCIIGPDGYKQTYRTHWVGNTVLEMTPLGNYLPMFPGIIIREQSTKS